MTIHPTAIVDPGAELAADVVIGPYSIIDKHVTIGARTVIGPQCRVTGHTTIGEDCHLQTSVVLGEPPQDRKFKPSTVSYLRIGDRNILREFVTMHLAVGEGNATIIGNDNMFMAYCHVGHNCQVGNNVCAANYVGLSGGCRIEDGVNLGGQSGIHQYVHIGRMAMIGGASRVTHDIPPFIMVAGSPLRPYGLNTVGLRRAGFSSELRGQIKDAFRLILRGKGNVTLALAEARRVLPAGIPEVEEFLQFVEHSGYSGRHLDPSRKRHG